MDTQRLSLAQAVKIPRHREDAGGSTISRQTGKQSKRNPELLLTNSRYDEIFSTGVVREYWLSVELADLAPDGYLRQTITFNGTLPGPTITADWGDHLVIHVTNNLAKNGTVRYPHYTQCSRNT
jgi:hypothetical protein